MNSLKKGSEKSGPFFMYAGASRAFSNQTRSSAVSHRFRKTTVVRVGAISLPANESGISSEHLPRRSGTCFELSLGRWHRSNGRNEQRHTKWHNRQRGQDADRQIIASHR